MLRNLYNLLPISKGFRIWLKSNLPLWIRRQSQFRKFGTVNELYFWRLDQGIDTVAPIQNYFSSLFPELDTTTRGKIWVYDRNGVEIARREFELSHFGMKVVRISELVDPNLGHGTFMWSVQIPDCVAKQSTIRDNLLYFTDRGYICYEKDRCQPAFVHGIDRYAVFQYQDTEISDLFYVNTARTQEWVPEFPIQPGMQSTIDVMLINRSRKECSIVLSLHRNGGDKVFETVQSITPRGAALIALNYETLKKLEGVNGYFMVSGMATPWGRPAITRHFDSGAFSVMHC
jgi:hypothetical protein